MNNISYEGIKTYAFRSYKNEGKTVRCGANREKVVKGYRDHFTKNIRKKGKVRNRQSIRFMEDVA